MSQHHHNPNPYSELAKGLAQFESWAVSADRHDDGWESDFPQWNTLMNSAKHLMLNATLDDHGLHLIERCWEISEETEDCAEFARHNLDRDTIKEILVRLTHTNTSAVRWQAYDALGYMQYPSEALLRIVENGLNDDDAYVRQRTYLALLRVKNSNSSKYTAKMLHDEISYVRFIAVKTAMDSADNEIRHQAEKIIDNDKAVQDHLQAYLNNKQLINKLEETQ